MSDGGVIWEDKAKGAGKKETITHWRSGGHRQGEGQAGERHS